MISAVSHTNGNHLLGRLRIFCWTATIILGALHAWAAAKVHAMNEDGICYLDMGDAYVRGDWSMAINTIWSPLYSWILGLTMHILKPSIRWEFPVVHFVNFIVYLGTLVCFEFFWRQVMQSRQTELTRFSETTFVTLPDWGLLALGYALFIWSSLNLIHIWSVTPDMCLAAFLYLAAGLILRIRRGFTTWTSYTLFGLVLGLSYLTKAAMFPMAFVLLGVGLFSAPEPHRIIWRILTSVVIFLLIAGPFIALLSSAKGRLTFSDVGKLTYVRHVNNIQYPHWQGDTSENGAPLHPTRRIFDYPPIYEFDNPVGGTYPVSYDPSYWYEGAVTRFKLEQQLKLILSSLQFYLDLFFNKQGGLVAAIFILYLMSRWPPIRLAEIISEWGLFICALVAFSIYSVVYVENRYVGAFMVIFWAALLTKVRLAPSQFSKKLASISSICILSFIIMQIITFNLEGFNALAFNVNAFKGKNTDNSASYQAGSPSWPGEVAEALHELGLRPGDKVAIIGNGFLSFWARLARVKIVAEMLGREADPFWLGSSTFQSKVIEVFKSTGAKAIIAEEVPGYAKLINWYKIKDTNYYVYLFKHVPVIY
jgi:hypothetical protein